jgi:hypothetical protein
MISKLFLSPPPKVPNRAYRIREPGTFRSTSVALADHDIKTFNGQ